LELEVDSLRRQLEYLDQLEEEEERAIQQDGKISSRRDWQPTTSELDDLEGGEDLRIIKPTRPVVQQMKPQLPPGIQIGNGLSQSKMNSSASGGLSPNAPLHITSPRAIPSDRMKKNNSVVGLSPRGLRSRPHQSIETSPPPISPRMPRQPSEGINVSPIRRVNGGPSHPPNHLEIVAKPLSEAKQNQSRNIRQPIQHPRTRRQDSEDGSMGAAESAENSFSNGSEAKQMQKQASKSVLKNVNRRFVVEVLLRP
jgi:hypothetical protein